MEGDRHGDNFCLPFVECELVFPKLHGKFTNEILGIAMSRRLVNIVIDVTNCVESFLQQ